MTTSHENLARYLRHNAGAAIVVALSYLASFYFLGHSWLHAPLLFPASGLAISLFFFEGYALWPAVYVAALIAGIVLGWPPASIIVLPIAYTIEALIGAWILRFAKIDPLFRSKRDVIWFVGAILIAAISIPTASSILTASGVSAFGIAARHVSWSASYVSALFSLMIITPFTLRWLAKPRFSRRWPEVIETVAVFGILIGIALLTYVLGITNIGTIPLAYFLILPLLWIALRLRPRFVSLAFLMLSVLALSSVMAGTTSLPSTAILANIFDVQLFITVLAVIFLLISSLEEERRLHSNLTRSQVATLENANARISSESEAKNSFIAILAHELRNPLAPIATSIDIMRLKNTVDAEDREMLAMMDDRMQTIRRLLDDMLDISRIAEGKVTLKMQELDLESVVRRAIVSTDHYFAENHQSLAVRMPKERIPVTGDAVRLEQVFSNLLGNASKYSNSGGVIEIAMRRTGSEAEVTVTDDGVGIPEHALEDIFIPFHQAGQEKRVKQGLGIGLALVRSFVDMHGGRVRASSNGKGKGSVFTVRLPLSKNAPAAAEEDAPRAKKSAPQKSGLRILIVDDNDAAAWSIGKLLEMRNAQVQYAYNGNQGIGKALESAPQVIILDIGLPDEDGYAVAQKLRRRGYAGKIIGLTGYSADDARAKGKEAGFDAYLTKPTSLADLLKVIPELG